MTRSSRRRTWNLGRFVQTLDFFEVIPVVSWMRSMMFGSTPPPPTPQIQAGDIFNFQQPNAEVESLWGALDDVVMGGVSSSSLRLTANGALFTGNVSTDNSGGFVSARTRNFEPALDLSGHVGILMRVKGDGQRYKFFIRDSEGWDSVA
ncbi:MAG: CIA30 family protein, partial [Cyanobacteria bacterium P01_F01_bin.33]